jgi:hypothetical protein
LMMIPTSNFIFLIFKCVIYICVCVCV